MKVAPPFWNEFIIVLFYMYAGKRARVYHEKSPVLLSQKAELRTLLRNARPRDLYHFVLNWNITYVCLYLCMYVLNNQLVNEMTSMFWLKEKSSEK